MGSPMHVGGVQVEALAAANARVDDLTNQMEEKESLIHSLQCALSVSSTNAGRTSANS